MAGASAQPGTWARDSPPGSWPVRWRIAATSAGLTLVILVVFGGARQLAAQPDPRRLQPRAAASAAQPSPPSSDRRHAAGHAVARRARARRLRCPTTPSSGSSTRRHAARRDRSAVRPRAARAPGISRTASSESPPRRSRDTATLTGFVQYGAQHRRRRLDDRPALALPRRRRPRRHPAGQPRRPRGRRPRDAPDRRADRAGPRDRHHPDPSRRHAHPATTRSASSPHHGADARSLDEARAEREQAMKSSASSSPTPRTSCARR